MSPEINKQRIQLQKALQILSDIETTERLFEPVDPTYSKVITEQLQRRYIDIMVNIAATVLKVAY